MELPIGSTLRVRWELPESFSSRGWVFGLDNVRLNLFRSLVDAFDCSGDGVVDIADANCAAAASLGGTLTAAGLMPGDVDGDGQVQFSDFVMLAANFGNTGQYTDGDFDKDGQVEFADFLILSEQFGQSATSVVPVPEPSTSVLALTIVGLIGRRRKRRRTVV